MAGWRGWKQAVFCCCPTGLEWRFCLLSTCLQTAVSFIGMESVGQARLGTSRTAHLWHASLGLLAWIGWLGVCWGNGRFGIQALKSIVFVYSCAQGLVILGICLPLTANILPVPIPRQPTIFHKPPCLFDISRVNTFSITGCHRIQKQKQKPPPLC